MKSFRLVGAIALSTISAMLVTSRSALAMDLDVVINEVLYQPPGGLDDAEFIELYNRGPSAVDLSGWRFTHGIAFTFPAGVSIPGGGYLVVCRNVSLASSIYPGVRLVGNYTGKLPDTGDRLRLVTKGGTLVEDFAYGVSGGWPVDASGRGASLERRTPESPPAFPDSWAPSLTLLGSPGRLNTQFRAIVERSYIVLGEDWRYFKGIEEPSAELLAWAGPSFDASSWLAGPTGIGYADFDDATELLDMQNGYSTVYLRKTFQVQNPGALLSLVLTIDYDDGFVAYLNGSEVTRRGAPGNPGDPVPFSELSTWSHEAGLAETIDLTNRKDLVRPGDNVLAIQGLNQTKGSTDFSLRPALKGSEEQIGADLSLNRLTVVTAVARGATWKYKKGTIEPATPLGAWAAPGQDETDWLDGATRIGYGFGGEATTLADMQNGYLTVYIRKHFTVTDLAAVVGLSLGIDYDDGFVAYLNGFEVARNGAPGAAGTPVPFDQPASISHNPGTEETFDLTPSLGRLIEGDNVLAIQGLNRTSASGDFSLLPALKMTRTVAGDPRALVAGISINEVHAPGGGGGWIEIYNGLDEEVDASGFGLTDAAAAPVKFVFPPDSRIPRKGFLSVAEASLGISLARAGTLLVTDGAGVVLVDGRPYSLPAGAGVSAGSVPDGDPGEFPVLDAPTLGGSNQPPTPRGVVINEVMYHPAGAPGAAQLDWIELHNTLGQAVGLSGWKLAGAFAFSFSAGNSIPAGDYLVVSTSPSGMLSKYGLSGSLGGASVVLADDDGTIELRDDLGNLVEGVHYADGGEWPPAAAGTGPSAERVSPALPGSSGGSWAASAGEGTPGAANSSLDPAARPVVAGVRHSPLVPRSTDPVTVTARVTGASPIVEVHVLHRIDGEASFLETAMLDDGASGDGAASDGIYGAVLPARAAGSVVEFFIEAEDSLGKIRVAPAAAPADDFLFQVDDGVAPFEFPLYRVVMTAARLSELATRDVSSDVPLPCTFIGGGVAAYAAGIHYQGRSFRLANPKSYRLEFPGDGEFEGKRRLDLNGFKPASQELALGVFRGADVPAPLSRVVELVVDVGAPLPYLRVEAIDGDFLRRQFAEPATDAGGNLYFGATGANLDWRGPDKESYRPTYRKETHQDLDDWSDLIALCDKLNNTPDGTFSAVIGAAIDAPEWARFFAAQAAVGNQEDGLWRDVGDDFYLYRRPSDGRFLLLPGDLDDTFQNASEALFRSSLAAVRRVLLHPDFTPFYYAALLDIAGSSLLPARMDDRIALLDGVAPAPDLSAISAYSAARSAFIDARIPQDLVARVESLTLVRPADAWRFFRGTVEPSGGTTGWAGLVFDDSSWETGPLGIGFGDGDDATVLADMQNAYTTVYVRRTFQVPDPSLVGSLELAIDFDDGFVAYLNGTEVARSNAGATGTPLAHDAVATLAREAGTAQTFAVSGTAQLLRAGDNVLAIQVLNSTIDSTDLSLIPTLRTGGVVAEGCPGDEFVTGESLILAGLAPAAEARSVRVNGQDAAYDHIAGTWVQVLPLARGLQTLTVQAIGAGGAVLATQTLRVYGIHTVGGTITEDTTWRASSSPFLVVSSVTIADDVRLAIEPGCVFLVAPGVGFTVVGEMQALGTEAQPITFDPMPCKGNWGGVNFAGTPDDNRITFAKFNRATALGCLWGGGSRITLDGCHIHDITGEGINFGGSTVSVSNTLIERTNEAMSVDYCGQPLVEFNETRNLIGKSDLCDMNGSALAHVLFNHFHDGPDDGLDFDDGTNYIEGNIIHGASDQAASMVGPGTSTFYRNVFYRCNIGVSSKDSHRVILDHNTIAFHTTVGLRAINKTGGRGYGTIDLKNSIVWGSPVSLLTDSGGAITASFCDLQAPQTQGNVTLGAAIISLDPRFANPSANDYRLQAGSPCIGAAEGGDDLGAIPFETLPRPPRNLAVTGTTASSVSLAWKDNSWVEAVYEVHRRTVFGFTPVYLVRKGDPFHFFRGRSEPSGGTLDWTGPAFDHASWETGATGIGYGDGDDATVLSDMQGSYSTVYLRRVFPVADASAITALELVVDFDDGFIAFLNGTEIARVNAGPAGTYPPFNGAASADHEAGTPVVLEVPVSGILATGDNVLAVQVLNILPGSSDLSMVPELRTIDEGPYDLIATLLPNHITYTDTSVDRLAKNSYRVRAVNGLGASAFSNTVTVGGGNLPADPTELSVTAFGPTSIALAWRDNAVDETSYELWRAAGAGDFELLVSLPAGTISHLDPGLVGGTDYRYKVRARNGFGPSGFSNEVSQVADSPPAAPDSLAVTAIGLTSISLSFQDNSDDETGFDLEAKVPGGNFQLRVRLMADVAEYTDVDLESGKTFVYRVRAVNAAGASGYSNELTAVTATLPPAPEDLTVQDVSLSSITLAWIDTGLSGTGCELERKAPAEADFGLLVSLPPGSLGYLDSGLLSGATYFYRVRATSDFGPSPYSNEVAGITPTLPVGPLDLSVTSFGLSSIGLHWTDRSSDEVAFQVERRLGAGAFEPAAELAPDTVDWLDQGLAQGTTYGYRVRARNAYGPSDWSNEVEATTARLPAAPLDLAVTGFGFDSISLGWSDASDNEEGFEIERSSGGSPFVPVGRISQDGTNFSDTGLLSATSYTYRVRAVNRHGPSPWSDEVSATTGRLPAAPSDLVADGTFLQAISLSWSDNSDNESGFEVERRSAGGGVFDLAGSPGADTRSFYDGGLESGKSYVYRVRAVNEFGASAWTVEVPAATAHLPADPEGLVVTTISLGSLELRWIDLADNETGYEVERRAAGEGGFSLLATLPAASAEHIDAGLPERSTYTYRVRAVNGYGASEYTAEVAATTPWIPAPPEGLTVELTTGDSVGLIWTDRADNETGYELERKGPGEAQFRLLVLLGAGADSYHDGGLIPGSTYSYRVRAVGEFGFSAYSGVAVAVTGEGPPAPEDLDLVSFAPGRIKLGWRDRSGGTAGAEVERAEGGDDLQLIASVPPGVVEFTDTTAQDGVEYRYRVRSSNAFGASSYTAEVRAGTAITVESVTPTSAPAAGGVPVTVRGLNFLSDTRVLFGGVPMTDRVRTSLYEMDGTVPPHAAGAVDIRVDNSKGFVILPGAFLYIGTFLRGDATVDGVIDISDPVALLAYLYLGGGIRCEDLGNVNQDGTTDISDAVALLGFLFLGGPAPFPETVDCP